MKKYRTNGSIGAILDEYERSIADLKIVISNISHRELITIVDHETNDPDCKSIQTILSHVMRAGYTYVNYVRRSLGENAEYVKDDLLDSVAEYMLGLDDMFRYNEKLFADYPTIQIEEHNSEKKMLTSWGQRFDVEQIMEHAIVHILRHRRQIERFLLNFN